MRRFLYKLCLALGKTEAELLEGPYRLTTEQLFGWQTYYNVEPFEMEDDIRFAALTAMVAKSFLSAADPADLFNSFLPERSKQDRFDEDKEPEINSTITMLECSGFTVVKGVRPV